MRPWGRLQPVGCPSNRTTIPRTGEIHSRSISTATARWSSVSESTRRVFLSSTKIPSSPFNGPSRSRTFDPTFGMGHGVAASPDRHTACSASISASSTGSGFRPKLTTDTTPGVFITAVRIRASNRQNTYPGNSGFSSFLIRSDHFRRVEYSGRNSSRPACRRVCAVIFSFLGATVSANQATIAESSPRSLFLPIRGAPAPLLPADIRGRSEAGASLGGSSQTGRWPATSALPG